MSVMVIDYGAISDVTSSATRLVDKFQNRLDNFKRISSGIDLIPTSRSNLQNATTSINNKNKQYQSKIDKLNLFGTKMSRFSQKAQATDERVASRITTDSKVFEKKHEINVSTLAVILDAVKTDGSNILSTIVSGSVLGAFGVKGWTAKDVRSLKDGIKDWYRKGGNRFLVAVAKDVVIAGVIAAVVIGTILSGGALLPLLGATVGAQLCTGFALFSGACSMGYDIAALSNYKSTGNATGSRWLDKEGGSDVLAAAGGELLYAGGYALGGENLAAKGKEIGGKGGKVLFSGMKIASYVYGGYKLVGGAAGFVADFRGKFTAIKEMGNMAGKSNLNVFGKTIITEGIKHDYKLKLPSIDIKKEFNLSKSIFGGASTYKKAFFNLGSNGVTNVSKEVFSRGSMHDLTEKVVNIKKEALRIADFTNIQIQPSMP